MPHLRLLTGALLLAVCAVATAHPLAILDDARSVTIVPLAGAPQIVAPEPLASFDVAGQFSTLDGTLLAGTGRASTPSLPGPTVSDSVYEVTFSPAQPVRLRLTGALLLIAPGPTGTSRVALTSTRRPFFGGERFKAILSQDFSSATLNFDETLDLDCHARYTLRISGGVSVTGDDTIASWLLDARATSPADVDTDADGVPDTRDNCVWDANPDQTDIDGDGFGNRCDIDFNQDGIPGVIDLGIFRSRFFTSDPLTDINSDGIVNTADLGLFRLLYFQPPGPSGLVDSCD